MDNPPVTISSSLRRFVPLLLASIVFLALLESLGVSTLHHSPVSTDFRQYYSAGILLRTEPSNLYSLARQKQVQDALVSPRDLVMPAVHPAYEAAFYSLFTFLPYGPAYLAFMVFNSCLLLATAYLLLNHSGLSISPGTVVARVFLFLPITIAVWHGQDSILFLFLCCLSWTQLVKGRDRTAGFILALALFRYHLAIPIAIFIALRKGWRFMAAFAVTGTLLACLCVAITGMQATKDMAHILAAFTLSSDHSTATQNLLGIQPLAMPNLRGLLFGCGVGHLSAHMAAVIVGVASLALFGWSLWRARITPQFQVAVGIGVVCTVLIAGHLYFHDLSLLLLPIFLLRERTPKLLSLFLYGLPVVLFLMGRSSVFFLIALPPLVLLWVATRPETEPVTTNPAANI